MKVKDSMVKDKETVKELFKVSSQLCGFEDELAPIPSEPAATEAVKEKADDEKKME